MPDQITCPSARVPHGTPAAPLDAKRRRVGTAHVILNPAAGGGRAGRLRGGLCRAVGERLGPDTSFCVTAAPGEAAHAARAAADAGASLVVVVGGDGTIHEVVNGLLGAPPPAEVPCELGIVNCGTGGGLSDSLGLPSTLDDQLDLLRSPRSLAVDVGHLVCGDPYGRTVERWFASECQIGIGAAVSGGVGPLVRRLGGRVAFGVTALRHVLAYRETEIAVSRDGAPPVAHPLIGLAVGNGSACAGGMHLTPDARLDDGMLDVLAIHAMGLTRRLRSFPLIYSGAHVRSPFFELRRAIRLQVTAALPTPVAADGEPLGETPCRITLYPRVLRIRGAGGAR